MLELSTKTNLLEENDYRYSLQDVKDPVLYRDVYNYEEIPKVAFNHRRVPISMPEDIWITDTSFRDGQQAFHPYTPEQIETLFKLMSKLGGPYGIIRQTEFFIYSKKDREAIERCRNLGLKFPEITTWIRASREDFKAVKDLGIRETGILVSCSDYHIFKKLKKTRREAMEMYLATVKDAFDAGVMPRCHLEDVTRADFYGFVVPFVNELMKLSDEAGIPVRIRACDTMGYGVPYTEVALPRSVPGIIYGLQHYSGVQSEYLEWHGHNDFYKAVSNAATAWLYGASGVNCTLLGIGERTGNVPLEAMVMEYASLRGSLDGMDPTVITEIADYYKNEIGYNIPPMTPFVGRNFNVTRAGIHADGLLKDEEIYNIFDTDKILKRPASVAVGKNSGLAGIAYWVNQNYGLTGTMELNKQSPLVVKLKEWVDSQYEDGRTASLSNEELEGKISELSGGVLKCMTSIGVSELSSHLTEARRYGDCEERMEHRSISIADQIFDQLERDILAGKYARGEVISELGLSKQLGVSRTPIREAIRRLEQEDFLEESGRGAVVVGISREDMEDMYEIRSQIEEWLHAARR